MNFSLFLNSRKRPLLLKDFLKSVEENTFDKKSIEVIIRYDYDDDLTHLIASESFTFDVKFIRGQRPENLHSSINELAKLSFGKNLFVCNDDIRILTKNWDLIAINKISEYLSEKSISDDIYYCLTSCNSIDRNVSEGYCSFPIISKKATEVLGFFMYDAFKTLGGDSSIYRLYKSIGRVIDVTEIKIDHVLHRTLQDVFFTDLVAKEYREKNKHCPDPSVFDISNEVNLLNKYISEKCPNSLKNLTV